MHGGLIGKSKTREREMFSRLNTVRTYVAADNNLKCTRGNQRGSQLRSTLERGGFFRPNANNGSMFFFSVVKFGNVYQPSVVTRQYTADKKNKKKQLHTFWAFSVLLCYNTIESMYQ